MLDDSTNLILCLASDVLVFVTKQLSRLKFCLGSCAATVSGLQDRRAAMSIPFCQRQPLFLSCLPGT